jgi:energy-converting hydrogenase Eha subunit H
VKLCTCHFNDLEITMKGLLYFIALFWIAWGTFVVVFTEKSRELYKRLFLTRKMKHLSVVAVVFGVVLIIGAFLHRDIFWFVFILGLLGISKGIYLYMAPPEQSSALMDWWFVRARPETVRLMGLVLFVLGIALFSYLR